MGKLYEIIACGKRMFLTKDEYDRFKNIKPDKEFLEECRRISETIFK